MGVTTAMFACLVASLSGPPGFPYHEAYLQVLPVSRSYKMCNSIVPGRDVSFLLYTAENGGSPEYLRLGNTTLLASSTMDRSRPTVVYLHGFLEGAKSLSAKVIKDAYMKRGDHNIILVDYKRLAAGPWYGTAVSNSGPVGRYTARFLDWLVVEGGFPLESFHVIGMSLGAHIAGIIGRRVTVGKIHRITGLDPAGPNFELLPKDRGLAKESAIFVDVIHTDMGVFGHRVMLGHADFYPNGGSGPQPGCHLKAVSARRGTPIETLFCSHWRAFQYYAESVYNEAAFPARSCNSWVDFKNDRCQPQLEPEFMGLAASPRLKGTYYLRTRDRSPYSRNL